jgi:DNA-binding NarL/FixJ family response regulator
MKVLGSSETRLVISPAPTPPRTGRAREAGAAAYVAKDRALEELGDAIRTAAARRELS